MQRWFGAGPRRIEAVGRPAPGTGAGAGLIRRPPIRPPEPEPPRHSWYAQSDGNRERFRGPDGLPTLHLVPYVTATGERVLRLCEDSTGLLLGPTDERLTAVGVYVSNIRGTKYHAEACRAGDFTPGAGVRLVPEPDNPVDSRALAVWATNTDGVAAYVNKQKGRALRKLIDAGTRVEAVSLRGTPAGSPCARITVLAAEPRILTHLLGARPRGAPPPAHLR